MTYFMFFKKFRPAVKNASTPLALLLCIAIGYGWVSWSNEIARAAEKKYPILSVCSQEDYSVLFDDDYSSLVLSQPNEIDVDNIPDIVDFWSSIYHYTVDNIVNYHMGDDTSVSAFDQAPKCEEENEALFYPPGPMMQYVASNLPPWKDSEDLARLSENDVGAVLLEYLAGYECALWERRYFISTKVLSDELDIRNFLTLTPLQIWDTLKEVDDQRTKIDRELVTARKIMNKTLVYLSGFTRLSQLDKELQCLQRASLDLRNVFSVAAESSSCLPRIWGAKDPLRDIFTPDE